MHLTYKTRIYPTIEQERVLWVLSDQCRLLYNYALAERKNEWEINNVKIGYTKQQNDLPYLKKKYFGYEYVYSKVLQSALIKLDEAYESFFTLIKTDDKARSPGFRGRKYFFTMTFNQSGFSVSENKVKFSQYYDKEIKLEFDAIIPVLENVKQVEICEDSGNYYICITYETKPPIYVDNNFYQAFDLGVTKQTAVNTDGKFFEVKNIRPDLYWKKPIAELQSRRDHCKPRGRTSKFLNKLKRKCERKCSNQIKDFQHKISKKIVHNTKSTTILVGDLSVKTMPQSKTANRSLNRSTQNTGYLARFTQFLTYKAEKIGKKVIKIDEHYTSKMCCQCGKIHDMDLSKRVMNCDCGNIVDRDRNSSVNIMVRFLSQNAMCTGYRLFAGNLRTGSGISLPEYSQEAPSARVG